MSLEASQQNDTSLTVHNEQSLCDSAVNANDSYLTYWNWLSSQTSSIYDLIDSDNLLQGIDPSSVLMKKAPAKPSILPYVSIVDLNNSNDEPYLNRPKPAIEIGLKFEF